jgi:hypothetical protein
MMWKQCDHDDCVFYLNSDFYENGTPYKVNFSRIESPCLQCIHFNRVDVYEFSKKDKIKK